MTVIPTTPRPTRLIFPDLFSKCPFPVQYNTHYEAAAAESKRWLMSTSKLSRKKRAAFHGLKGGLLAARTYRNADFEQLRMCCDWLNYLFHMDDVSDEMDDHAAGSTADEIMGAFCDPEVFQSTSAAARLTHSYWARFRLQATPQAQRRFVKSVELFVRAIEQQAKDREAGVIPDMETYVVLRRNTGGCRPCWVMLEYANNIDLPDEVIEHPCVQGLEDAANDLVAWSNDLFSYNVEWRAKGDTHNIIVIVQSEKKLELQAAVDYVGKLCEECFTRFQALHAALPSWGPEVDAQVEKYVEGLSDWMIGNLEWSFESERYFGRGGPKARRELAVTLLPPRKELPTSV